MAVIKGVLPVNAGMALSLLLTLLIVGTGIWDAALHRKTSDPKILSLRRPIHRIFGVLTLVAGSLVMCGFIAAVVNNESHEGVSLIVVIMLGLLALIMCVVGLAAVFYQKLW